MIYVYIHISMYSYITTYAGSNQCALFKRTKELRDFLISTKDDFYEIQTNNKKIKEKYLLWE